MNAEENENNSPKFAPSHRALKERYSAKSWGIIWPSVDVYKRSFVSELSPGEETLIASNAFKTGKWGCYVGASSVFYYGWLSYLDQKYVQQQRTQLLGSTLGRMYSGSMDKAFVFEQTARRVGLLGGLGYFCGIMWGCHQIYDRKSDQELQQRIDKALEFQEKRAQLQTAVRQAAPVGYLLGLMYGWDRFLRPSEMRAIPSFSKRLARWTADGIRGAILIIPGAIVFKTISMFFDEKLEGVPAPVEKKKRKRDFDP